MSSNWFFYHAGEAFNASWELSLAEERREVTRTSQPMFATVLDVAGEPDSGDWNKIKYRGPLYFDFDLDSDDPDALQVVCDQFRVFLEKIKTVWSFDLSQAYLYASGGKGFHVEIPMGCFVPKIAPNGYSGLPSVYREMTKKVIVESMDMNVYSGRKGRMWRQQNVRRKNGRFKVRLTIDEAESVTAESYLELCAAPRNMLEPGVPTVNAKMALAFDSACKRVTDMLRSKKRKSESSSKVLDMWRRSGRHPDSMSMLMDGAVRPGASFQKIAMQLAIYASTMGMEKAALVDLCKSLCDAHVGDGVRYNTPEKRRKEIGRMLDYMQEDDMYVFDPLPIAALLPAGTDLKDIGLHETEAEPDRVEREAKEQEDPQGAIIDALQLTVRRGVSMHGHGLVVARPGQDSGDMALCRATFDPVNPFYHYERESKEVIPKFLGYEVGVKANHKLLATIMVAAENFSTAAAFRRLMLPLQQVYQGSDAETMGLMDILNSKSASGIPVYVYPREGLFVMNHPLINDRHAIVYLTKDTYMSSIPEDDPDHFGLTYRANQAVSGYNIDIHRAKKLGPEHLETLKLLFKINTPEVVADVVGWFVASHYRSFYLHLFDQFPLLQLYGEAGSGKSQTMLLMSRLHWFRREVALKSCMSLTPFALDNAVSTSTSAPLVLDEYKPRELAKVGRGKLEKLKDAFKASYIGGEVGDRGTLNRSGETQLAIISNKCTAPIVFMAESAETETAILERCITVAFSQASHTTERIDAFEELRLDTDALSSLGRAVMEMGFRINLEKMAVEFRTIVAEVKARNAHLPARRKVPERLIFNRAVVTQGLLILKRTLAQVFGTAFDEDIAALTTTKERSSAIDEMVQLNSISEMSKAISRIALLSRRIDTPWEIRPGKDYLLGPTWVEIKVEAAFDKYRAFCMSTGESPLFDSIYAFQFALRSYVPVTDKHCVSSPLREEGSTEMILRLDLRLLQAEGVQSFRT